MKKVLAILIAILVVGVIGITYFFITADTDIKYPSELTIENVKERHIDLEGYDTLEKWYAAYTKNKEDYDGRTASVKEEYGDYVTEEQEKQMGELENQILNSTSVNKQKEAIKSFEAIVEEIQTAKEEAEAAWAAQQSYYSQLSYSDSSYSGGGSSYNGDPSSFKSQGVIYDGGTRYTWYSQNVLPGGGLNIPGRHVGDNDLIYDSDGYVVVASSDHGKGSVVDTPFGEGKVYDDGCDSGTIDIYTNY